jgi:hypothetical protein
MVFAFFNLGMQEIIVLLFMALLIVWPFWRIFTKAGFTGWLAIGMLFPLVNLILVFYLAFAEWPALLKANSQAGELGTAIDRPRT